MNIYSAKYGAAEDVACMEELASKRRVLVDARVHHLGGDIMNQAVKKLPLMLGVVGAIAFAAATPSWAVEKGSAASGASAQAGAQTKATGSSAKMSGKMSGHAASSEGMKTGQMKGTKTGQMLSSRTGIRSSRTDIGARENLRNRTSVGLREARFRDRRYATGSVGVGVNAGFADTGFYGWGSPGYGYAAGYGAYPGYGGYGYAAGYPGCTCGAPGVAFGYGYPAGYAVGVPGTPPGVGAERAGA